MHLRKTLSLALVLLSPALALAHPGHGDHDHDHALPSINGLTNQVKITIQGDKRVIESNGIPDHTAGRFPNRGNPHTISAQQQRFAVPVNPQVADRPTPLRLGPFGIALNGVLFDPGANEWWNRDPNSGWQYEALSGKINLGMDVNNAHVQPNGKYHYHGLPVGLIKRLSLDKPGQMIHVGWAADGFPIYALRGYTDPKDLKSPLKNLKSSHQLKKGNRPAGENSPGNAHDGTFVQDYEYVAGSGELDEANGRFGVTPEFPQGTYYYVLTDTFPFVPRMWKGTPDESFLRGPRGPGGMRGGPGGPPPRRE